MPYYISPPPQNPVSRIITGIIAMLALAGALMIGMVALLVVGGVVLVAGIGIWLRVLWIKRQIRKNGVPPGFENIIPDRQNDSGSGQVIDAEYSVVSDRED